LTKFETDFLDTAVKKRDNQRGCEESFRWKFSNLWINSLTCELIHCLMFLVKRWWVFGKDMVLPITQRKMNS